MAVAPDEIQMNWIRWAIDALSNSEEDYERFADYYDGDHELEFATDKWLQTFGTKFEEFADNWCQVVIDAPVHRLEILGWESADAKENTSTKAAEKIWDRNWGPLEADDVHTQGLVKGDAYIFVWEDPDHPNEAQFFYNDATEVSVFYDPLNPRRISRAAKKFVDLKGQIHLYLYFPTYIDKFMVPRDVSPDQVAAMQMGLIDDSDARALGFIREDDRITNPLGEVPIVHFKNRARGSTHGLSELKPVIPVQNAVNKLLMDMMVGSEFGSFRQKYVAGGGQPRDGWKVGGDRVWATSDPQARFGEFGQIDLEPIFKAVEVLVAHIGKITGTPMHYLRTSGDMPSGEAMKTAESALVKKVMARHKHWGASWSKVMELALKIEGKATDVRIFPKWKNAETRHELEQGQVAQLKSILGVPLVHLWSEHFGYTEEQIDEFERKNQAVAASVLAQVIGQIGQLPPGSETVTATPQQLVDLLQSAPKIGNAGEGQGLDISQILALLPKSATAATTAGEATTKPQPNSRPPASPTRRSTGFKD